MITIYIKSSAAYDPPHNFHPYIKKALSCYDNKFPAIKVTAIYCIGTKLHRANIIAGEFFAYVFWFVLNKMIGTVVLKKTKNMCAILYGIFLFNTMTCILFQIWRWKQ